MAELSDAEALGQDGMLITELRSVAMDVSGETRTFSGNWVVNGAATRIAMESTIETGSYRIIR